jgi:hypothetical protein
MVQETWMPLEPFHTKFLKVLMFTPPLELFNKLALLPHKTPYTLFPTHLYPLADTS